MAHQSLITKASAFFVSAILIAGCGGESTSAPHSETAPAAPSASVAPLAHFTKLPLDANLWGDIHSHDFALTVRVPDAANWKTVDNSLAHSLFFASHPKSRTGLAVGTFLFPELMNRARCEERIRDMNLVTKRPDARIIEDESIVGPEDFDTRILVTYSGGRGNELLGELYAFGSHIRKCLFMHFAAIVTSDLDTDILVERLAAARTHILPDLKLDSIDAVPRAQPL